MKIFTFLKKIFSLIKKSMYISIKNLLAILGLIVIVSIISSGVKMSDKSTLLLTQNIYLESKTNKLNKKYDKLVSDLNLLIAEDNDMYRLLLNIEPVDYDNDHVYDIDIFIEKNDSGIVADMNKKYFYASKMMSAIITSKGALKDLIKQEGTSNFDKIPIIQPIMTEDIICVSSTFGLRFHPFYKRAMFHDGIDISAKSGGKIVSTASGIVESVTQSNLGYGNKVIIDHGNGYKTLYAHLKFIKVEKGQFVIQGQQIGAVGSTGLSTGDHLHYEIKYKEQLKDPLAYFQTYLTPMDENGKMFAYKPLKSTTP